MNTDFSYCPGFEPDGELKDQPQMCQQCKRYLSAIRYGIGDYWYIAPCYTEVDEDCGFYLPTNSEKPNN